MPHLRLASSDEQSYLQSSVFISTGSIGVHLWFLHRSLYLRGFGYFFNELAHACGDSLL